MPAAGAPPLAVLGIDAPVTIPPAFSAAGRQLAWGSMDGTVRVYDLEAVRARLAEVGLGW